MIIKTTRQIDLQRFFVDYIRYPSTTLYNKTDLPTDPLLAVHTRKNALSPAPDHDPRRVIVEAIS
jgi:hypothetical protein